MFEFVIFDLFIIHVIDMTHEQELPPGTSFDLFIIIPKKNKEKMLT